MGATNATDSEETPPRLYGGRTPEERQAERRTRLMATAYDKFGTIGMERTVIADLCREAGVSTRHFYELFPSMTELLAAVYLQLVNEVITEITDALAKAPQDPRAMTEAALNVYVHRMLDDPRTGRIVCLEATAGGLDSSLVTGVIQSFVSVLESQSISLMGAGKLSPQEAHWPSVALIGAAKELVTDWLSSSEPPAIDRVVAEAVRVFARVGQFE